MAHKSGFVTIVGRPNVGKSTLLNQILGQKIVITSDKAQTTRKRIKGVYTTENGQIIFIDTPGVHKPKHKLGEFLLEETSLSIPDADIVLFLVDGSESAGLGDKWIIENLLKIDRPIILVVNKIDKIKDMEKRELNVFSYKKLLAEKSATTVKVSAQTGRNIDTLIKNIYRKLPSGPKYYTEDELTDQTVRNIVEEMVREGILRNTKDEIPHSIAVVVDKFEEKEKIVNISANIFVEHDSQKKIVIGEKGSMLKTVGSAARIEIEKMVDKKVFLELFVKVKKDWRKNDGNLKEFGYFSN